MTRLVLPSLLLAAAALPVVLNSYQVYLLTIALVYVVLTIGFTIVIGWSGQFAFTNAAFFGVGAFASGRATVILGAPTELAILVGLAVGTATGLIFGALVVRMSGYYLAVGTIALTYVLDYGYRNFPAYTGGVSGFHVPDPRFALLGGAVITSDHQKYYIGLALAVLVYAIARRLRRTSIARSWRVIRRDERTAAALGIDVYVSRLTAFVASAAILALAGAWSVFLSSRFLPSSYGPPEMLFHFLIVVVGGLGSLNGAVGAALVLVLVREGLRTFAGLSELLFGAVLLSGALFFPRGLYGAAVQRVRWLREGVA